MYPELFCLLHFLRCFMLHTPFLSGNRIYPRTRIDRIIVFFDECHAIFKCNAIRSCIRVFHIGIHAVERCMRKDKIHAGPRSFRGIAPAPEIPADMIANLRQMLSVDILHRNAAVADELTGFLQYHGPQSKAKLCISLPIPSDPSTGFHLPNGAG